MSFLARHPCACVDGLVAHDADVSRDPVDADFEGASGSAEAREEGVESGEEVLPRLCFGGGEG
jgi:hypothetical protein